MNHLRKKLFALLVGTMTFGCTLTVNAAETNPFADVNEAEWYYPFVSYVVENHFMSGSKIYIKQLFILSYIILAYI